MGLTDNKVALAGAGFGAGALLYWLVRPSRPSVAGPEETGFGAYLRDLSVGVPTAPSQAGGAWAETSFEAYLRPDAFKAAQRGPGPAGSAEEAEAVPGTARPVAIVFGTEFGFSKEISERLATRLREAGEDYWPVIFDMADFPEGLPSLAAQQAVLVVCSTQGDGVPPAEARGFCTWLGGLKPGAFDGVPFSVCALGDTAYTHFCRCGKTIDAQLESLGGTRFAPRSDVNKENYPAVDAWIDGVISALPVLSLRTVDELQAAGSSLLLGLDVAPEAAGQKKRWSRNRPFLASVVEVEGLCTVEDKDDKNTVRVEVNLGDSGLTYIPGDALGIWPYNDSQAVEELVQLLGGNGDLLVRVPSWHYADPLLPEGATSMPLRDALTRCYDLRQPKAELFEVLHASLATAHAGKACDGGACAADKLEELDRLRGSATEAETYLEPRHLIDVLVAFQPAGPAVPDVLSCLRQLAPRLYSISSSQREAADRVQATVAIVRYESLGRARAGVASCQLGERAGTGTRLPVYIHANPDFRLPEDPTLPIIMVGPGTGLAPFRSFLMERELAHAAGELPSPPGPAVLFFGCRRRDQDYLYGSQLEGWAESGAIRLHTAFSREAPDQKVYVQHRLAESGKEIWDLLQAGGHFYVCGDAAAMAVDVEAALLALIQQESNGDLDAGGARVFLDGLAAQGRYQRDVWF